MNNKKLPSAFSQNRAEELSLDVWNDFVAPTFLPDLDILGATKPRIVVGGRGCGKTMLLRYFSFESQFSRRRSAIPDENLKDVGLYWRIDTQFASVMNMRGLAEIEWVNAFEHFLVLFVSAEILRSLQTIRESNCNKDAREQVKRLSFRNMAAFGDQYAQPVELLGRQLQNSLRGFEMWVSNVQKLQEPLFLPKTFVSSLIECIRDECPALTETSFHVFVDEFENLLPYQQRVINTHIKHSQKPLVFSVAMKRRGFITRETLGSESITEIDDYRQIDLEHLLEEDFASFAGEVLLLNLWKADFTDIPINPDSLRNVAMLEARKDKQYQQKILAFLDQLFPGLSDLELAQQVFEDKSLKATLRKRIENALIHQCGSSDQANKLIDEKLPRESVVCSALAYRGIQPAELIAELKLRKKHRKSKFDNWTDNNFVGCLLLLYEPNHKVCPFYAGYRTFLKLSKGNLRHLLELCSKSLASFNGNEADLLKGVNVDVQAKAARQASVAFLQEVKSFGNLRNQLHAFVLRLGSLFALSHGRATQSQPEVNHFSITGRTAITAELSAFLDEAIKWTVLFEEQETKVTKSSDGKQANYEYVLNPIYAPYFNISYRKRRRIELDVSEVLQLVEGDYETVSHLLKRYSKRWSVDLEESSPTLFSHLVD